MNKVVYNDKNDELFKNILGELIHEIVETDDDAIYLDADLMTCIKTKNWAVDNPDKAINCGIAEANMAGISAGLSSVGFKPIMHTFGSFASRRCFDQVFLSGGYAGNDMTIIGTDAGVCATYNGATHIPLEDVALYRTIPNAVVMDITDVSMLKNILPKCIDYPGVKYLRMGRKSNKKIYADESEFEIGKGEVVAEYGYDCTVIASGVMVSKAIDAARKLKDEGINVSVIDMFTIKPLDSALLLEYAMKSNCVVTAENHNLIGGLYSAVSTTLCNNYPVAVEAVGINDRFGEVGSQEYLEETFGLTIDDIINKVKKVISRKH